MIYVDTASKELLRVEHLSIGMGGSCPDIDWEPKWAH